MEERIRLHMPQFLFNLGAIQRSRRKMREREGAWLFRVPRLSGYN